MENWQPIKTAPTDGTEILVYCKPWKNSKGLCGGGISQAYYRGFVNDAKTPWWTKVNPRAVYPTRWMPLPKLITNKE